MTVASTPVSGQAQSIDPHFAFHTLGWSQFELLCHTVISDVLGQAIEIYEPSNDSGQDALYLGSAASGLDLPPLPTVFQFKYIRTPDETLKKATLTADLRKARSLYDSGVAKNYVLVTNGAVTGQTAIAVRKELRSFGMECQIFARRWLTLKIRESQRLRQLVPRVFGLGDLHEIIDSRAYRQTDAVLKAMGFRMETYVVTKAYRDAANALNRHRFVLLIGDPGSGKTSIAYALALNAANDRRRILKLTTPAEFAAHWNPDEPAQFMWFDDVFGETQYDVSRTREWGARLPQIQGALKHGATIVFTSRSYIWNEAKRDIKLHELTLLNDAEVQIHVSDLTRPEREAMLYNHLRLGDQTPAFKKDITEFLPAVVAVDPFFPEAVRRLGKRFFTQHLPLTEDALTTFFAKPLDILKDTVLSLDGTDRAFLALMFARESRLQLPLALTDDDHRLVELMGGSADAMSKSLRALSGNLVTEQIELDGTRALTFAHPTVRDAMVLITGEDPQLLEIYLTGASTEELLREAACGQVANRFSGHRVIIPTRFYGQIVDRLRAQRSLYEKAMFSKERPSSHWPFLRYRSAAPFLKYVLMNAPDLLHPPSWTTIPMSSDDYLHVASALHVALDSAKERQQFEAHVRGKAARRILASADDDPSVLTEPGFMALLTSDELTRSKELARQLALTGLHDLIDGYVNNWSTDEDPEDCLDPAKGACEALEALFSDDEAVSESVDEAREYIDYQISEMNEQRGPEEPDRDDDDDLYDIADDSGDDDESSRSIFSDLADAN